MRLYFLTIFMLAISGIGCSTTQVTSVYSPAATYTEIMEHSERRTAQIRLVDGATYTATSISIERNTVSWVTVGTRNSMEEPFSNLDQIKFVSHSKGGWRGFLAGALLVGGYGALVGLASGDGDKGLRSGTAREKVRFNGLLGAAIGGYTGALIGTIRGHYTIYEFVPREQLNLEANPDAIGAIE